MDKVYVGIEFELKVPSGTTALNMDSVIRNGLLKKLIGAGYRVDEDFTWDESPGVLYLED